MDMLQKFINERMQSLRQLEIEAREYPEFPNIHGEVAYERGRLSVLFSISEGVEWNAAHHIEKMNELETLAYGGESCSLERTEWGMYIELEALGHFGPVRVRPMILAPWDID